VTAVGEKIFLVSGGQPILKTKFRENSKVRSDYRKEDKPLKIPICFVVFVI
jgi:hypothetical protein